MGGQCLGDKIYFRIWCRKHDCDLKENEHYDDWFQKADLSGWFCPEGNKGPYDNFVDCTEHWAISPVRHNNINIFDFL